MKPRCSNQRNRALTLIEVLVVILVLAIVAAMTLPAWQANRRKRLDDGCKSNLEQIHRAYQSWESDHNGKFPMGISVTNGGTMELAATGNAVATFQILSNELQTPMILICPADKNHVAATNFVMGFTTKNISYFVGLDADTNYPQVFLSGDDNFAIKGVPVKSGLLQLETNAPITWTVTRHNSKRFFEGGYILLVDGSIRAAYDDLLIVRDLNESGVATNRLAIP